MTDARELIALLTARALTVAVAESLTGGLLVAELIAPAGASLVVNGGVVAYNTGLKHTLLGVDAELLAATGPVDPDVAIQMARNVRERLGVAGRPADIGLSTTGVAGPDAQGTDPPGTVYLGLSMGDMTRAKRLDLNGSRDDIRSETVSQSLAWLSKALERGLVDERE
ncbi:nicotinamide-nucleotide amidase [Cryobacterium mesophilum]|uniref:Nicotinamide-nucleotide amidohydrolase family protein n=1 Tax=Terrimesophilobacter mesophilus TaxID=433647 RepID=A0A4R8VAH8_9MICO|nr:nicotinamide-nucleotide amidohydrolase family protein [Terrimesophilobacter mesophilus]MBB5632154.1 nicotinamide-nucleotide amidase [Terrimesophilobacter mesophilus]TFB79022.1 nicotinamide-nucleotide amidohydrolase family protein [Terrimesophilobacter mesophilus]